MPTRLRGAGVSFEAVGSPGKALVCDGPSLPCLLQGPELRTHTAHRQAERPLALCFRGIQPPSKGPQSSQAGKPLPPRMLTFGAPTSALLLPSCRRKVLQHGVEPRQTMQPGLIVPAASSANPPAHPPPAHSDSMGPTGLPAQRGALNNKGGKTKPDLHLHSQYQSQQKARFPVSCFPPWYSSSPSIFSPPSRAHLSQSPFPLEDDDTLIARAPSPRGGSMQDFGT